MSTEHVIAALLILTGLGILAWLGWHYARASMKRTSDHYENSLRDIGTWQGRDPGRPQRMVRRYGEGDGRNPGLDD